MKRDMAKQVKSCSTSMKRSSESLDRETHNNSSLSKEEDSSVCISEATVSAAASGGNSGCSNVMTKKAKKGGQLSQLTLNSFFQKSSTIRTNPAPPVIAYQLEVVKSDDKSCFKVCLGADDDINSKSESIIPGGSPSQEVVDVLEKEERNAAAALEWRRIQQAMQNKIPLCKGHKEPCVSRVVKKGGPNFGRRFYTCARAEVNN